MPNPGVTVFSTTQGEGGRGPSYQEGRAGSVHDQASEGARGGKAQERGRFTAILWQVGRENRKVADERVIITENRTDEGKASVTVAGSDE